MVLHKFSDQYLLSCKDKSFIFKTWKNICTEYMKNMFDNDWQSFYTFATLKEKYNLPTSDFLKHLTILNRMPKCIEASIKI